MTVHTSVASSQDANISLLETGMTEEFKAVFRSIHLLPPAQRAGNMTMNIILIS
jgi:hypothetical protein